MDLIGIKEQQRRIEKLEQQVEYLIDSRSRYAKYFNAFCWFLEEHGVEPMHSDNHPRVLENQLHAVVKNERDAATEKLREYLQKVLDDSEIGVVPKSHLDSIRVLLEELA